MRVSGGDEAAVRLLEGPHLRRGAHLLGLHDLRAVCVLLPGPVRVQPGQPGAQPVRVADGRQRHLAGQRAHRGVHVRQHWHQGSVRERGARATKIPAAGVAQRQADLDRAGAAVLGAGVRGGQQRAADFQLLEPGRGDVHLAVHVHVPAAADAWVQGAEARDAARGDVRSADWAGGAGRRRCPAVHARVAATRGAQRMGYDFRCGFGGDCRAWNICECCPADLCIPEQP